jgi:predicted permease
MQSNLFVIVQQIAVLFFYIAIGFTVRMFKIISEEGEKSFASFIINITFSALIISSFATENDKSILLNIWMIGAVAIFSVLVLTLISIPAAKFINGNCKDDISISRLLIIFGNTGFLGLPIAFSIFGSKGVLYVTIYNFFQAILYWPIVLTLIQNTEKRSMASRLKFLINVPFFFHDYWIYYFLKQYTITRCSFPKH